MSTQAPTECPDCSRVRTAGVLICELCGHVFERPRSALPAPAVRAHTVPSAPLEALGGASEPRVLGLPEAWFFLTVGAVTAPIFAFTPILQYMGWFLASLTHEMGHAAVAWLFGMPAFPAIRLDGHAAAFHQEQKLLLVLLIAGGLAAWVSRIEPKRVRVHALVLVVGVYLGLALTPGKEILHLAGGHGGELCFATICLWRAITGGFTESPSERALYGTVGWFLLGSNVILTTRLVFSDAARSWYARSGSFGLTNDYIRLAEDVLGTSLPVVAAGMTLVALGVLPLAFLFARLARPR